MQSGFFILRFRHLFGLFSVFAVQISSFSVLMSVAVSFIFFEVFQFWSVYQSV